MTTDKVLAALHGAGGTVMRSSHRQRLPKPQVEFRRANGHSSAPLKEG